MRARSAFVFQRAAAKERMASSERGWAASSAYQNRAPRISRPCTVSFLGFSIPWRSHAFRRVAKAAELAMNGEVADIDGDVRFQFEIADYIRALSAQPTAEGEKE